MIINIILIFLILQCAFGKYNSLVLSCGLIGFSGFKDKKINPLIAKFLLLHNESRGQDAMGLYSKESGVIKESGKPRELLTKEKFKIPVTNQFIGHVRSASSGGNGDDRAHPFKQGNIVLAMNGTITNHYTLATNYGIDTKLIWVDSDYLCAMLNKTQTKEPLSKIDGSCACIYIDTNTDKMYVYRNIDRPLFKGYLEEGMYISSTKESLEAVECTKIVEFKPDNLYEIVDGAVTNTFKVKRWVEPTVVRNNSFSNGTTTYNSVDRKWYKKLLLTMMNKPYLVGEWLEPKNTLYTSDGAEFKTGYRYLVTADSTVFTGVMDVQVFNPDKGKSYPLHMFRFKEEVPEFESQDCVFATTRILIDNDITNVFCEKGHMLIITSILHTSKGKEVHVKKADDFSSTCYFRNNYENWIRVATVNEATDWRIENIGNKITTNLQLPAVPKKTVDTEEVKYRKELESVVHETYDDFVTTFTTNLDALIEDLELTASGLFEIELINKMKILSNYYKETDKAFEELNRSENSYGG